MRNFIMPVLAASGLALAAPVAAASGQVEIRIDYNDLDLANPSDVETLERRIEKAVEKACTIESAVFPGGEENRRGLCGEHHDRRAGGSRPPPRTKTGARKQVGSRFQTIAQGCGSCIFRNYT